MVENNVICIIISPKSPMIDQKSQTQRYSVYYHKYFAGSLSVDGCIHHHHIQSHWLSCERLSTSIICSTIQMSLMYSLSTAVHWLEKKSTNQNYVGGIKNPSSSCARDRNIAAKIATSMNVSHAAPQVVNLQT